MRQLTFTRRLLPVRAAVIALMMGLFLATALNVLAAHESNNRLTFAPVNGSSASGKGVINYVAGSSGEEPNTNWTSSFQFTGLAANTTYNVVVQGRFADATAFSTICTFTTNSAEEGSCANRFMGLQRLGVAQVRVASTGEVVLEARRAAGMITSQGGNREK